MTDPAAVVTAIDKTLSVLEALAEHERLTDLAKQTGLPKSTVHRILQSLMVRGFAAADGSGGYLLGPRILTLAGKALHRIDPARQAGPALTALRDRTGHTVHFGLRTGDEAVYVAKLPGHKPYQMSSRIGMSLPLHSTAIGKAILAQLPESEVRAFCARTGLPRRTPHTITSVTALSRQLKQVLSRGYALDDGENELGLRCVGAAVFNHEGQPIGAVSISTLEHELPLDAADTLGAEVARTAQEISAALGAPVTRAFA